jgi:ribonuclease J
MNFAQNPVNAGETQKRQNRFDGNFGASGRSRSRVFNVPKPNRTGKNRNRKFGRGQDNLRSKAPRFQSEARPLRPIGQAAKLPASSFDGALEIILGQNGIPRQKQVNVMSPNGNFIPKAVGPVLSQNNRPDNGRIGGRPSFNRQQHGDHGQVRKNDRDLPNRHPLPSNRNWNRNLRVIPLGGLGEVGRNMILLEYENSILILDAGFRMPGEDMPGIDYIIPNIDYLKNKVKNIVGVVFTHGHYDHIGAVPYIIDKIWHPNLRLIASPLTKAIILKRQEDFPGLPKPDIEEAGDGSRANLGPFSVEFFRLNHNIPDNYGIFIQTPVGNVVDTSDFKFDSNPVNERPTDFKRLRDIGRRRILLLLSDSTGAEEPGHSLSELEIFENLEKIFQESRGRIIAATFGSLLNRIQQLIHLSEKYGRKVAVDGYSMKNNIEVCRQLKYIRANKNTFIQLGDVDNYPDNRVTVICTGAQGEADAVLMKIVNREHRFLRFRRGDSVIFSSSVIPGNERTVQNLKDDILRQGVRVYHYKMMDIHAGGHAKQEELMEMMRIMRPKFFVPIHGQFSMLVANADLARSVGIPEKNIVVAENGAVVTVNSHQIALEKEKVSSSYVMVDGLGVGDIGEVVLRDRQMLSHDGMFVIVTVIDRLTGKVKGSPDIISRGFVYLRESKDLLKETRKKTVEIIDKATSSNGAVNWTYVKDEIRNKIGDFLYTKTERRPMILPVVIEV